MIIIIIIVFIFIIVAVVVVIILEVYYVFKQVIWPNTTENILTVPRGDNFCKIVILGVITNSYIIPF